jgi:hypothetical protein
MLMMMIRNSLVLLFLLCSLVFSQTTARKQTLSLSNHLMSKFLGVTVTYSSPVLNWLGRPTDKVISKQGEVIELAIQKSGYVLKLDNEDTLQVIFSISRGGDPNLLREFKRPGSMDMQIQALKAQEFINNSIKNVNILGGGSSGFSSGGGSSSLSSIDKLLESGSNDFAQGEEILYTDERVNKRKKGFVTVSTKGLFLDTGSPVKIILERIDSGK